MKKKRAKLWLSCTLVCDNDFIGDPSRLEHLQSVRGGFENCFLITRRNPPPVVLITDRVFRWVTEKGLIWTACTKTRDRDELVQLKIVRREIRTVLVLGVNNRPHIDMICATMAAMCAQRAWRCTWPRQTFRRCSSSWRRVPPRAIGNRSNKCHNSHVYIAQVKDDPSAALGTFTVFGGGSLQLFLISGISER